MTGTESNTSKQQGQFVVCPTAHNDFTGHITFHFSYINYNTSLNLDTGFFSADFAFQMASSFSKDNFFFSGCKQASPLSCLAAFTYAHSYPADSKLILSEGKANVQEWQHQN